MPEIPSSSTSKRIVSSSWQSNEEDRIIRQQVLCNLMLLIKEQADRTQMHYEDKVCLSVAQKLEGYFYRVANSRAEYMNSETLLQRVKTIGRDIWLKEMAVGQQQRHL